MQPTKKEISPDNLHEAVINEYFSNGFNATQAVLKIRPELEYHAAGKIGHLIINSDKNKTYIAKKKDEIGRAATVQAYQLANELKLIAFNDITDYLNLTLEEIKQLSPEQRRALKKITLKEKQYRYKDGSQATEKTLQIEAHDKLKAAQELGKIIGIYEIDNRQKQTNIQLNKLDIGTLNNILAAIDSDHPTQDDSSPPQ